MHGPCGIQPVSFVQWRHHQVQLQKTWQNCQCTNGNLLGPWCEFVDWFGSCDQYSFISRGFQFQNDNMVGSTSVMTMMKLKKVNDKLIKSQMLHKTLENFVNQTSPIMCHVRSPRHRTCGEKYFSKTLSWRLRLQLNSEKGSPGNSNKKDLVQG